MKQKIIELLQSTQRPGIENLLTYLEETDFYRAPASTQYHGAYAGGLMEHSLQVYENLVKILATFDFPGKNNIPESSPVIVGLLHDLCKVNFYQLSARNVKNESTGQWEKVPSYIIDDQFPAGHGEKSVIMLQRFIGLTMDEILAIRWHMGGYDDAGKSWPGGKTMQKAMQDHPLAAALHMADLAASFFDNK